MYYVEQINRHGGKKLIRIDVEDKGRAIGIIVASDDDGELGQPWSNRVANLSRLQNRPATRYDFTLDPELEEMRR